MKKILVERVYNKWIRIGILIFTMIILSGIFLHNSFRVYEVAKRRTQKYALDVTEQIRENMDEKLEKSIATLKLIRSTAVDIDEKQVGDYLESKCAISDYNYLSLVNSIEEAEAWLQKEYGVQYSLDPDLLYQDGIQLIAISAESTVLYFVTEEKGRNADILIGIKQNIVLEEILNSSSFKGQGNSFAITNEGTIITASTAANVYNSLAENYNVKGKLSEQEQFAQMRQQIKQGKSGTISLLSKDKEVFLLAYNPLKYSGWYIITMLPSSVLGVEAENMATKNLIWTIGVIVLLGVVIVGIFFMQKRYTRKLEHFAFYDKITGGKNNNYFQLEVKRIIRKGNQKFSIVSIDIKDFKILNNAYGIQAGNATLRYLYRTIKKELYENERITRGDADIFYVLLNTTDREKIIERLSIMYKKVNEFNNESKWQYYLEMRFGIYVIKDISCQIDVIQEYANLARKYNDKSKNPYVFYDDEFQAEQMREKEIIGLMEQSLKNGDFQVYLQPKVGLATNCIRGAEALVRWYHPEKGMLSPAVFIPVFEKYRIINTLDKFVFEEVCKVLHRWEEEGKELCTISVNLSRQNFDNPNFLKEYYDICMKYHVSPNYIEFELTETIYIEDSEYIEKFLEEMHRLGFQCSLDDFGTGYSSLGILKDLSIDVIKLDRSFFVGSNAGKKGQLIVKTIIDLAKQLQIRTVAEGIDEIEQVEYLRSLGCDKIQGFIFFRPLPIPQFEEEAFENNKLRCNIGAKKAD